MKKYVAKIYDITGVTIDSVKAEILNVPEFTKSRNGGFGECQITLNYGFDELGSKLSKIVRIYMIDQSANKTGKLIYTGYVSKQTETFGGGLKTTELTLLGIQSLLTNAYYKDADYSVTHTNDDPSVIFKAIIDHFKSVYAGSLINYTVPSVDTVGVNVTYTFANRKWFDAIDDTYKLIASGWYWYINESGIFHLHQNPASATHKFTSGKDIEELAIERTVEEITNKSYLTYNGGNDTETDATSITNHGLREDIDDDQNITTLATAQQYTDKKVKDNKDIQVSTTLVINSNYNIESINAGDTCKIQNLPRGQSIFSNNMRIERILYRGDKAILYLDNYSYLSKELKKII